MSSEVSGFNGDSLVNMTAVLTFSLFEFQQQTNELIRISLKKLFKQYDIFSDF